MNIPQHIAKHFREVYFGGNWTCVNLRDTLTTVTLKQATMQVNGLNTISVLVYHMHYYVRAATKVLQGGHLDAHDKYSFDLPSIATDDEWQHFLNSIWAEAETFAQLVESLPDEKIHEHFTNEKYGAYYRNLHGIIEHAHYHLGQIAIIKKITLQSDVTNV